jgi:hypothetical protein
MATIKLQRPKTERTSLVAPKSVSPRGNRAAAKPAPAKAVTVNKGTKILSSKENGGPEPYGMWWRWSNGTEWSNEPTTIHDEQREAKPGMATGPTAAAVAAQRDKLKKEAEQEHADILKRLRLRAKGGDNIARFALAMIKEKALVIEPFETNEEVRKVHNLAMRAGAGDNLARAALAMKRQK